jgi:hypothetical protein
MFIMLQHPPSRPAGIIKTPPQHVKKKLKSAGNYRENYAVYIVRQFWHYPINTIRANGNEQSMNIAKTFASKH